MNSPKNPFNKLAKCQTFLRYTEDVLRQSSEGLLTYKEALERIDERILRELNRDDGEDPPMMPVEVPNRNPPSSGGAAVICKPITPAFQG